MSTLVDKSNPRRIRKNTATDKYLNTCHKPIQVPFPLTHLSIFFWHSSPLALLLSFLLHLFFLFHFLFFTLDYT